MSQLKKRDKDWFDNIEKVKKFAEEKKKWPSTTSSDPEEKVLAQWWSRQKYLLNQKNEGKESSGMSEERQKIVHEIVNNFKLFERDGVWEEKFNKIVNKYKEDNHLWPYSTENIEEQKCIRWWNQQKTFARRFKTNPNTPYGGMNAERLAKIEGLARVVGFSLDEVTDVTESETSQSTEPIKEQKTEEPNNQNHEFN